MFAPMRTEELMGVLLFVGTVGAVYAVAGLLLCEAALQRVRGRVRILRPGLLWFRRIVFGLALAGVFCIAYGRLIEPFWLEVTRVRLESPKLEGATRPIRIVHFSDLHSDPHPRLEERLPDVVAAEKPDLIVFTGDAINSRRGLPVARRCFTRLAAVAPTFVVKGNWDAVNWRGMDIFKGTGVRELNSEAVKLTVAGVDLWVAGIPYGGAAKIPQILEAIPPQDFTVFLSHVPGEIYQVARHQADLYCAGHTHGGQVALPFYGALITLSRFGKRFEAGLYRVEETRLYVNRGVGMEGGCAPRVRFFARPELTVIDLVPPSE
ncbi:MAG: metallophosphoesterase [Acidobacteria bacterium]|nr:metallophosphoesterase [Acidobacteriota bacterium]